MTNASTTPAAASAAAAGAAARTLLVGNEHRAYWAMLEVFLWRAPALAGIAATAGAAAPRLLECQSVAAAGDAH